MLCIATTLTAVLLAGCSGGTGPVVRSSRVVLSQTAVSEGARLVGAASQTVEASADDVSRLSTQAGVSEEVVRSVAPQLDQQSVWQRSVNSARSAYRRVPEELKQPVTSVACQAATGQIENREDFYRAVAEEFDVMNMSEDELGVVINDISGLYEDLVKARQSTDPNERASAVLFCFTVSQLEG